MTLELLTLIGVSVPCDVFGQTFFKLGAIGISEGKPTIVRPHLWVASGLVVYAVEIFVWLGVLAIDRRRSDCEPQLHWRYTRRPLAVQ